MQVLGSPWPTGTGKCIGKLVVVVRALTNRYGFHMPRTNARDAFYNKLEEQRAAEKEQ